MAHQQAGRHSWGRHPELFLRVFQPACSDHRKRLSGIPGGNTVKASECLDSLLPPSGGFRPFPSVQLNSVEFLLLTVTALPILLFPQAKVKALICSEDQIKTSGIPQGLRDSKMPGAISFSSPLSSSVFFFFLSLQPIGLTLLRKEVWSHL